MYEAARKRMVGRVGGEWWQWKDVTGCTDGVKVREMRCESKRMGRAAGKREMQQERDASEGACIYTLFGVG